MKHIIILIFLTFYLSAQGQNEFGLKASLGRSKINFNEIAYHDDFSSSNQIGIYYVRYISDFWLIGTELLLVEISGKTSGTFTYSFYQNGDIFFRRGDFNSQSYIN